MKFYHQAPKSGPAKIAWLAIARTVGAAPIGLVFANESGYTKMWIGRMEDGRFFGFDTGWGPQSRARLLKNDHANLFSLSTISHS